MVSEVGAVHLQVRDREELVTGLERHTAWQHVDCLSAAELAWTGSIVHALAYAILLVPGRYPRSIAFPTDRPDWMDRFTTVGLR